jgi:hypothetical protein
MSGTAYIGAPDHKQLLDETYCLFSLTNPLHGSVFPSVRQMEAEVVAMTAELLGGGPAGPCPTVCGAMTSGGTESILCAMKASRDYMKDVRKVQKPEIIIAESAHAAYYKVCTRVLQAQYLRIVLCKGNQYIRAVLVKYCKVCMSLMGTWAWNDDCRPAAACCRGVSAVRIRNSMACAMLAAIAWLVRLYLAWLLQFSPHVSRVSCQG